MRRHGDTERKTFSMGAWEQGSVGERAEGWKNGIEVSK